MIYFTSDWHIGEDRLGINGKPNLFYRPFKSVQEQDTNIYSMVVDTFKDGDTLYNLGDVIYKDLDSAEMYLKEIKRKFPNSKFILILGNYDVSAEKLELLSKYYEIHDDLYINIPKVGKCYLNHYPTKALENMGDAKLGITGHIHSLWKVQRKLINVGIDAWNYKLISIDEIAFCYNAMENFYDNDVFPYSRK